MDTGEVAKADGDDAEAEGGVNRGGGGVLSLEATGLLTQDAYPGGTTLVNALNGSNKLIHLAMLWMVLHYWPGSRFTLNCYRCVNILIQTYVSKKGQRKVNLSKGMLRSYYLSRFIESDRGRKVLGCLLFIFLLVF